MHSAGGRTNHRPSRKFLFEEGEDRHTRLQEAHLLSFMNLGHIYTPTEPSGLRLGNGMLQTKKLRKVSLDLPTSVAKDKD